MRPDRLWLVYCSCAVAVVAALLPCRALAQTPTQLLTRAASETQKLRDPAERALVLADLAQTQKALGDERWAQTLAEAVATGDQVEEGLGQAMTWRGLAVRAWGLDPTLAHDLRDRALKSAGQLDYAAPRSLALREIGRSLLGLDSAGALGAFAEARAATGKIETPLFRSAALRDLAAAIAPLDESLANELFGQAAADLASITPPDDPVQLARIELVVAWSRTSSKQALQEAGLIPDDRLREVCYRRVVEALASADPEAALEVAGQLHDPGQRGLALAAVAVALAKVQPEAAAGLARSAITMTAGLSADDLARLWGTVATALAYTDLNEALLLVARIEEEGAAAWARGQIALAVASFNPVQAAKLAGEISDWEVREGAQAQIAPLLALTDQAAALTLLEGVLSRRDKVRALLAIATAVTGKATP